MSFHMNSVIKLLRKQKNMINVFQRSFQRGAVCEPAWREPIGYLTGISIYNPVTKCKVPLILKNDKYANWYMCGPTVYDSAHIGHACCYVKLDIIRRILMNFFDINVVVAMGITDVDDKIITKSVEMNEDIKVLCRKFEKEFFDDLLKLNVLPPTIPIRVTDCIPGIVEFVQKIFDKGLAYKTMDGSVYFDTIQYKYYGKFTSVMENNQTDMLKKNSNDFALWKAAKPKEPFWSSPWGKGRPGWHIECSTIASSLFGSELDIHSGGKDLAFPHHENEEAQSCTYHGVHQWVNYWIHTGHLHMKGSEKMSKSLKNTISVGKLLELYTADQFRMFCLLSNYRNNVEYSDTSMELAIAVNRKIESFLSDCDAYISGKIFSSQICEAEFLKHLSTTRDNFKNALADDFDSAKGLVILMDFISHVHKLMRLSSKELNNFDIKNSTLIAAARYFVRDILEKLGLQFLRKESYVYNEVNSTEIIDFVVAFRNDVRNLALSELKSSNLLNSKNGPMALLRSCDKLRNNFQEIGIEIKDHGVKSSWNKNELNR